uniref:Secreted protein n=1 Tax=Ciona savignyi TaxID=51511 RepID=H2YB96_CIOSA
MMGIFSRSFGYKLARPILIILLLVGSAKAKPSANTRTGANTRNPVFKKQMNTLLPIPSVAAYNNYRLILEGIFS